MLDTMFGALAKVAPEQIPAACEGGPTSNQISCTISLFHRWCDATEHDDFERGTQRLPWFKTNQIMSGRFL